MKTYRVEVRIADYDFSGAVARMLHGGVPQSSRKTIEIQASDYIVHNSGAVSFFDVANASANNIRTLADGEWFDIKEVKKNE